MNKKATYFHWIALFGILGALGLFFWSGGLEVFVKPKGTWQMHFLNDIYLEAEKEQLKYDLIAEKIGMETIKELVNNGGYEENSVSGCGKVYGVNLWNTPVKVCFPSAEDAAGKLADKKLRETLPQKSFTDVKFSGNLFVGKGDRAKIITDDAKYSYDTGFAVFLSYSFDEYKQLKLDSAVLISTCWNSQDLKSCLDKNKGSWKYASCEQEAGQEIFQEDSRKVPFCVEKSGVQHKFALDFNALTPSLVKLD